MNRQIAMAFDAWFETFAEAKRNRAILESAARKLYNRALAAPFDRWAEYAEELKAELPASMDVAIWDDDSEMLEARIDLLLRNARLGLVLVFVVLAVFTAWCGVNLRRSNSGRAMMAVRDHDLAAAQ